MTLDEIKDPTTWTAKFLASAQGDNAGILENAIQCVQPAIMTESAVVTLQLTQITTLDQEQIDIAAGPENEPSRIELDITGRVQSITLAVNMEWENGQTQEAEVDTHMFADQDGQHVVLVWCGAEPPSPRKMAEFAQEILGHQLDQQTIDDLVSDALHPEGEVFEFRFQHRVLQDEYAELKIFPPEAHASVVVEFTGNEAQALNTAQRLHSESQAAEAVRMALTYHQLPPDRMYDEGLPELAELYSAETGEAWEPMPAAEIPLHVFAHVLEIANEIYWENHEKSFHITPDLLREHGVNVETALRRR